MKKSEIIREMSKIYNERVMYFLNEDTVYDKHGNNIIQKAIGLKVFEKASKCSRAISPMAKKR